MTVNVMLVVVFFILCIVGCSQQQEGNTILQSYNNVENIFESYSQFNVQINGRKLVHVKVKDHVIMNESFLNTMATLMHVNNYKEFQFHSNIPVFTTRLTPQQIHQLSKNAFAKNSIAWIKKVTNSDKRAFSKLTLESFKIGGLRIVLDSKLTEMERLQTLNRLRNWYVATYTNKMSNALSRLDIRNIRQSINDAPMHENIELSFPSTQDEGMIRDFIREQTNSLFDLEWNADGSSLEINLANFDYGVWKLIKEQNFNHPIVQSLKRREQVQKFFKQSQLLDQFVEEMSTEMGQEFLEHLINDDSVDLVLRQRSHETKNYGANQVIQNGGGSSYTYFWDNGITGSNEVVSVLDTGITLGHCFFAASGEPTTKTTVNLNYRKVVYNGPNGNNGDLIDSNGHGTHVAGTIAGYPQTLGTETIDKNVGVAKDAKIYGIDAQKGSGAGLYIGDMSTILDAAFTSAGSRISSNSWGCGNPYNCDYDCNCYITNTDKSTTPVTDAKCMADTGTRCCHFCNVYGYDSNKIDTYLSSNDEVTVVIASGNDGLFSADQNTGDPATSKNGLSVGASFSPSSYYKQFFKSLNYTLYEFENMAGFSGKGPTYDGRIKPDISAPGFSTISSINSVSCDYESYSGTSMATPAVSGASALIRHYLVKDSNKKLVEYNIFNKTTSQTLSGTLVKAMVIHSGESMNGFVQFGGRDVYLNQFNTPNKYVGFGRINLQNVLKIDADSSSVKRVGNILLANRYSLDVSQQVGVILQSKSITTLKVTLVWYDLPSSADTISSVKNKKLINDIDLVVTIGSKNYFGNGASNGNVVDSLNTVESVLITNIAQGTKVTVRVSAKSDNKGTQAFSMVITGDVTLIGTTVGQSSTVRFSLALILLALIINLVM